MPIGRINIQEKNIEKSLWAKLKAPRTVLSITTEKGGMPSRYNLIEPGIMILFYGLAALVAAWRIQKTDKEAERNILLESVKAILQIGVGVLIAIIIFGLGVK